MNKNDEITRRTVITGIVAAAAVPLLSGKALAAGTALPPLVRKRKRASADRVVGSPRYLGSSVTMQDGRVMLTGGYHVGADVRRRGFVMPSNGVQIFDPAGESWTNAQPMVQPRARHASVLLSDGRVAVLGGFAIGELSSVEVYDPATNQWSSGHPLPRPMADISACCSRGKIIVTGGDLGTPAMTIDEIAAKRTVVP